MSPARQPVYPLSVWRPETVYCRGTRFTRFRAFDRLLPSYLSPQPHLYLERLVERAGATTTPHLASLHLAPLHLAPFHPPSLARLLALAYEGRGEAACFAPAGRMEEWEDYARRLLEGTVFGSVLLEASFTISVPGEATSQGAIVVTEVGEGTAHIAQVAVDPRVQGRGLGEALVQASLAALAACGFTRVTLLVARNNRAARRLYARLGFEPCGQLVFAAR